jgi:signal transduction histidine kinase
VNDIVEKVLILSRTQCETHQIEVLWNPADDLPDVSVVADRIRQVFLNLVLNAVDFMPEGGHLQVSTSRTRQPDGVEIVFADTGPGIDPDLLPHLFEPFRSGRREGMGLGLYISKTIVAEHGGHIDVASETGQGTTFTVWLPLERSKEER